MKEEVKRIERVRKVRQRMEAALSDQLTGEQVFLRSCNTCHAGLKANLGPALDKINERFTSDNELKQYIRTEHGVMPGQPIETISDIELSALVVYLREASKEASKEKTK